MALIFIAIGLLVVNFFFLALTAITFPGNWLMLMTACLLKWWKPEIFSWWTLAAVLVLALIGEWLEFITSAKKVTKAGGSRMGGLGAIIGSLIGLPIGQVLIPVPVVGLLAGACLGAFAGAMLMESVGGKGLLASAKSGEAAATGRLLGTIYKLICGVIIYAVLAVAVFWS